MDSINRFTKKSIDNAFDCFYISDRPAAKAHNFVNFCSNLNCFFSSESSNAWLSFSINALNWYFKQEAYNLCIKLGQWVILFTDGFLATSVFIKSINWLIENPINRLVATQINQQIDEFNLQKIHLIKRWNCTFADRSDTSEERIS